MYGSSNQDILVFSDSPAEKSVVLTFDDGPSRLLPEILDVLKTEQVPAVFFWQSKLLHPKRPWKRVLDEGHLIGTHSVRHRNFTTLPYEEQYRDLQASIEQIEKTTGIEVRYFRPPFGQFNDDTLRAAGQLNVKPVMWRVASMDWELKGNPEQILTYVTENLEDDAIILLHELPVTLQVLPELIRAIREKGYGFKLL